MSIAIITACWKRPETFRAFLLHSMQLEPAPVAILCAGSPDDECADIAAEFGIHYQQVPNVMSHKWNHAVGMASGTKATHYLFMGSDDFMDHRMWDYYQRYTGDHLGLKDLYFYNEPTKATAYWPGYLTKRRGEPIGAAKLVRREVLEALGWAPFSTDPARWNSLDRDMHQAVINLGVKQDVVTMRDTGGICLDVKGTGGLTTWQTIIRQPGVKVHGPHWLRDKCPQLNEALSYL
jgi:hypothetical protein